jgi:hypothetical protein
MSYNPRSLFNKIQQSQASSTESAGNFANPLIFKPKPGTSYSIRLLWLAPEAGFDREFPMINSYIHRVWDDAATAGNKEAKVICPTSQYIMGETSAAFRKCPICESASAFYKKGQEGSDSAKELYKKFRRTFIGYVPVYIVNGPEEDIHQVKILQYGKQFKDFFDSKIFGIQKQSKYADDAASDMMDDEALGLEAFMYYDESTDEVITRGYNLVITTSTKKMVIDGKSIDMPQYSIDFTRKLTNITDIDGISLTDADGIKYFNSINSQILHFDKDFYQKSTEEELNQFKLNFISRPAVESVDEAESIASRPAISLPKKAAVPVAKPAVEAETAEEEADEIPMGKVATENTKRAKTVVDESTDEIPRTADGEVDVQSLLNGILDM